MLLNNKFIDIIKTNKTAKNSQVINVFLSNYGNRCDVSK